MMEPTAEEGSLASASPTEVSQLLADNLGTLLEDSRTLRELSNIHEASLLSNNNDDNDNADRLEQLRAKVTGLEEKLNLLRVVVREEQTALDELETLNEKVHRRNHLLKELIEKEKRAASVHANEKQSDESTALLEAPQRGHIHQMPAAPQQDNKHATITTPSPALMKRQQEIIRLQRITQSEFDSIPRTSRGRISLSLLNEALMEIQHVLIRKFGSTVNNSSSSRRNKWQHHHDQILTEDDKAVIGDRLWVTEQELRSSCPFFRHGESTARATLLLLRTLHRLQQVPRKQPDFLYVVVVLHE